MWEQLTKFSLIIAVISFAYLPASHAETPDRCLPSAKNWLANKIAEATADRAQELAQKQLSQAEHERSDTFNIDVNFGASISIHSLTSAPVGFLHRTFYGVPEEEYTVDLTAKDEKGLTSAATVKFRILEHPESCEIRAQDKPMKFLPLIWPRS